MYRSNNRDDVWTQIIEVVKKLNSIRGTCKFKFFRNEKFSVQRQFRRCFVFFLSSFIGLLLSCIFHALIALT